MKRVLRQSLIVLDAPQSITEEAWSPGQESQAGVCWNPSLPACGVLKNNNKIHHVNVCFEWSAETSRIATGK